MSSAVSGKARPLRHDPPRAARRRRSSAPPPPVDERLVMPETRFEIIDGRVEYVPPADEPHGTYHPKLGSLLEAHAADDYEVALDMLTRTSETGDMAPDASVFPKARDEATGGRKLEELAFEIVSTQRMSYVAKKARALHGRGVRRIFAVDLNEVKLLEWSQRRDRWEPLSEDASLEDRALAVPLPVRALLDTTRADDAVAAALLARKNAVLEGALHDAEARGAARGEARGEARGMERGVSAGKVAALLAILHAKGFVLPAQVTERIRAASEAQVDAWLLRSLNASSLEGALGEEPQS